LAKIVFGIDSENRFQTYRSTFSKVFRRLLENRTDLIPHQDYIETRFEANALVQVWKHFQSDQSPLFREKLRIVVRGATFTSSEGRKTEPRDILFELETAALLKSWGLAVQLGPSTDLSFKFRAVPILCECKRVHTPNAFGRNFEIAEGQLRDELEDQPPSALGLIAVDVSRIVHLDVAGLERYPSTNHGSITLPSNMVAVQNEFQFEAAVKQHRSIMSRDFVPRVAGFMLCYNIPAVDLKGSGRIFVLGSQKVGSFASATPFERKFFEQFHRDMLENYRRRH
jgi:hypothetical protein